MEINVTTRHGSPTFYKLLDEMAETHDKKSHDYASNSNPYGNYHFAGQVSTLFAHSQQDAGFAGRIAEKIYRLANLEGSQKVAQNESVEDTERDIAVLAALWMADRRNRRKFMKDPRELQKAEDKQGYIVTVDHSVNQYKPELPALNQQEYDEKAVVWTIRIEPNLSRDGLDRMIRILQGCRDRRSI